MSAAFNNVVNFQGDASSLLDAVKQANNALKNYQSTTNNLTGVDLTDSFNKIADKFFTKTEKDANGNIVNTEIMRRQVEAVTKSGQMIKFALDGLANDFENTAKVVDGSVQIINKDVDNMVKRMERLANVKGLTQGFDDRFRQHILKKTNFSTVELVDQRAIASATEAVLNFVRTGKVAETQFLNIYREIKNNNFITDLEGDAAAAQVAMLRLVDVMKRVGDKAGKSAKQNKAYSDAAEVTGGMVAELAPGGLGSATPQALSNLATVRRELERLLVTSSIGEKRLREMFNQIRAGATDFNLMSDAERQAEIGLRRLLKITGELETAGKRTQDIMLSWTSVVRLALVQGMHRLFSGFISEIDKAKDRTVEYSKQIGLIQTISQNAARSTRYWEESILDLSAAFNVDRVDAAKAAYEGLSNQVAEGARIIPFMESALKLSVTTNSTAMDSVNLLSSAIKGFGLSAIETERITSTLWKTIDVGRVKVGAISDTLGNSAPMAASLGISMEELLGSLAILTQKGIREDTALTLLNNVMLSLLKPSEEFNELLQQWGVNSGEAAVGAYGFTGVLKLLGQEFERGGLGRIADIAKNMRTIRAEAGLLQGGLTPLFDTIDEFTDSTDAANSALKIMENTLGVRYQKLIKSISNEFDKIAGRGSMDIVMTLFGDPEQAAASIRPLLDTVFKILKNMTVAIKSFTDLAGIIGYLIPSIDGFNGLFSDTVTVLGTAGLAFNLLNKAHASLSATIIATTVSQKSFITSIKESIVWLATARTSALQSASTQAVLQASYTALVLGITAVIGALVAVNIAYNNHKTHLMNINEEISRDIEKSHEQRLKDLQNNVAKQLDVETKALDKRAQNYFKLIAFLRQTNKAVVDLARVELQAQFFERQAKGADGLQEKITALMGVVATYRDTVIRATNTNNFDEAAKAIDKMKDSITEVNDEIDNMVSKLKDDIDNFANDLGDVKLEEKLFGKKPKEQLAVIQQEIKNLMQLVGQQGAEDGLKTAERLRVLIDKAQGLLPKNAKDGLFGIEQQVIQQQVKLREQLIQQLQGQKIDEQAVNEQFIKGVEDRTKAMENFVEKIQQASNAMAALRKEMQSIAESKVELDNKSVSQSKDIVGNVGKLLANTTPGTLFGNLAESFAAPSLSPTDFQDRELFGVLNKSVTDKFNTVKDKLASGVKPEEIKKEISELNGELEKYVAVINKLQENAGYGENFLKLPDGQFLTRFTTDLLSAFKQYGETSNEQTKLLERERLLIDIQATTTQMLDKSSAQLNATLQQYPELYSKFTEEIRKSDDILKDFIRNFSNAVNTINGGGFLPQSNGGLAFAPGGLIGGRLGRDNQMVRVHSGEYIVNEQAARMYAGPLAAMNAGMKYSNGGSVVNIDAINVNASNVSDAGITARELGQALRRELRSGTIRLRDYR